MPNGYLDFAHFDRLKGQCAPRFFMMPATEKEAQELEDAIRRQKAKDAEPPAQDVKKSGWHQILRAFTVSTGVVDSNLASDAARIVSALCGVTVTASDMMTARHANYISERELDIVHDPVMAWWRHPLIRIPDLWRYLKHDASEALDRLLEQRGINIKPTYQDSARICNDVVTQKRQAAGTTNERTTKESKAWYW